MSFLSVDSKWYLSRVSYGISAITLSAILTEKDKDLELIPVERNRKKKEMKLLNKHVDL